MKISSNCETPLVVELKRLANANDKVVVVGTHNGCWHADELLAIAIIREAMPGYKVSVIRSRDPKQLARAHVVVDVGGGKYDHHGPDNKHYPCGIPYAACGLVLEAVEPDRAMINQLNYEIVYGVSIRDNGWAGSVATGVCATNKLEWVGYNYPTWEERPLTQSEIMGRFYHTLDMVHDIYHRCRMTCQARIDAPAVLEGCPRLFGGSIIELPTGGIPWTKYACEHAEILAAIYRDDITSNWLVKTAKYRLGDQRNRVDFPASWGGLFDEELRRVSSIDGAVFCHRSLFLASFKTRTGALAAARILKFMYEQQEHSIRQGKE